MTLILKEIYQVDELWEVVKKTHQELQGQVPSISKRSAPPFSAFPPLPSPAPLHFPSFPSFPSFPDVAQQSHFLVTTEPITLLSPELAVWRVPRPAFAFPCPSAAMLGARSWQAWRGTYRAELGLPARIALEDRGEVAQVGLGFPAHLPNNEACGNGPPAFVSSGQADLEPPHTSPQRQRSGGSGGQGDDSRNGH